jgi:hypothetical protein
VGRQALQRRTVVALAALAASLVSVSTVAGADSPVVTVTQTFTGLNDVVSGGFEPPDVSVAAGAGFVVELVNLAQLTWSTTAGTAQVVQQRDLSVLFGSGPDRLTDPRVLFDAPTGRWLASISDLDKHTVLLAVSPGTEPTGTWTTSSYPAGGCADQPRLGIADGVVVLSADIFRDCEESGARPGGAELWTVNKAQLLAGSTTPAFTSFGPTADYSSFAPVQSLSPTTTEYVVSVDDRASRLVHLLTVDGIPPGPVDVHEVAAPAIQPLLRPPPAGQPPSTGVRPAIATNDNRILDSVWENGRLWFSANARCIPGGDALIRSCARIVELATDARAVRSDTDLGYAGANVFYPALRPDANGDLVVVAGESGQRVLPELIAVGRTPDGVFTTPVVIARSVGIYRGDRYGDYFGAARDPLHPETVWVGGEMGSDIPSGRGWATALAAVVVTGAGSIPPAVAANPPPGVRAASRITRAGSSIRLSYLVLDDGAAVRAVVVVRNAKKAIVFRTATARATLHEQEHYTVLWPAKKARGRFSYCVNTVSISGLESPRSCVAIIVR